MLSIIIPSYKASSALNNQIGFLIEYLRINNIENEILIVDDGSNDNGETKEVAQKHGCIYIPNPVNMGKGGAVRNGMLNSKGDIKIFTDADIPFEFEAIDQIIKEIGSNGYDMVVGDRKLDESVYHDQISRKRSLGSSLYSFVVARFISGESYDTQCGLKAFKKSTADDLFKVSILNSFAFDVELISIALRRKYKIKKIPVKLRSQEGNSVNLMRHAPGMVADLFKVKWRLLLNRY